MRSMIEESESPSSKSPYKPGWKIPREGNVILIDTPETATI